MTCKRIKDLEKELETTVEECHYWHKKYSSQKEYVARLQSKLDYLEKLHKQALNHCKRLMDN